MSLFARSQRAQRIFINSLKLREILKREDLVRMLKAILESTPPLKVSNLASRLSITIDAARRRLRLIRNAGISIGIDVNHYGLGLTKLFIAIDGILDEIPTPLSYIIKWRAHIISPRPLTMMIFYQPINVDKRYILQSLSHRKIINVFEAQLTIRNKPNFNQYFDPRRNEFIYPWDEVKAKISKCITHVSLPQLTHFRKIDWLDLLILSVLEDNALMSISDIARKLNVSRNKVSTHYRNHLVRTGIIKGFYFTYAPFPLEGSLYILVYLKGEPKVIYAVSLVLREIIGFGSAVLDIVNGNGIYMIVLPYDVISGFLKFLDWLKGLVEEIHIYVVDRLSIKSYSVPFLVYSPKSRFWDLNVYDVMKERFEKLFQREKA